MKDFESDLAFICVNANIAKSCTWARVDPHSTICLNLVSYAICSDLFAYIKSEY